MGCSISNFDPPGSRFANNKGVFLQQKDAFCHNWLFGPFTLILLRPFVMAVYFYHLNIMADAVHDSPAFIFFIPILVRKAEMLLQAVQIVIGGKKCRFAVHPAV